jgi:hypothetical protein
VVDLAVRVAARCEHEHRPAECRLSVGLSELDVAENEPGEHDEKLGRVHVEPCALQLL